MNTQPLLTVLLTLLPSVVAAAELPITGVYSSGVGCQLYAAYGVDGVKAGGGTMNFPEATPGMSLIVTPMEVIGGEFACDVIRVTSNAATLSCYGEGMETNLPAKFHHADRTFIFTIDSDSPIALYPCSSPSSQLNMNVQTLIAASLTLLPSVVAAAELPISGAYGSDYACDLYRKGGVSAVSAGNSKMAPDFDFRFLVIADRGATVGDPVCSFTSVEDRSGGRFLVEIDCELFGNGGWNYFFLSIDGDSAEVTTDDDHDNTIRRCETSVSTLQNRSLR